MRSFLQKNWGLIIFILVGAFGGFLYWYFIGCQTGTCPIKSKWHLMTLYGAVIGYLLGDFAMGKRRKKKGSDLSENE